jgi:catechol 2,3-dioxygenase-like lactoylglutathione lyase family enzyme
VGAIRAARHTLPATLADALAVLPGHGRVRQLRLVVRADDFDEALAFYRDVVGMPQSAAYEADGGAPSRSSRPGGRPSSSRTPRRSPSSTAWRPTATLERSASGGLEVGDAAAVVDELADAGARVEASARIRRGTRWAPGCAGVPGYS